MSNYHKSSRNILKTLILIFICIPFSSAFAQTENDAVIAIQQAEEKLIDVIEILENISKRDLYIEDLVLQTDSARQLINAANLMLVEGDYEQAYRTANDAKGKLDILLDNLNQRINETKQKSRILYSVSGFLAAAFTIAFAFLFLKRIYPWFRAKQHEEYGKLEIKYENTNEEIRSDQN